MDSASSELKYSRQRAAILENVKGRKDHPTADMVYSSVRETYPKISLGTVYRNLSLLTEMHEIRRLHCGDGTEHYDGDISDHGHFICTGCGRIVDLFKDDAPAADDAWPKHRDIAKIAYRSVIYYGTCTACEASGLAPA
jgi:Fur family transcriptional regulator, peroxide stress response regulator